MNKQKQNVVKFRKQYYSKALFPKWEVLMLLVLFIQIPVIVFDTDFSILTYKWSLVALYYTVIFLKIKFEGARLTTVIGIIVEFALIFRILNQGIPILHTLWFVVSLIGIYFYGKSFTMFKTSQFPKTSGPFLVGYHYFRMDDQLKTEVAVFYPTTTKTNVKADLYVDKQQWKKQLEIQQHRLMLKSNASIPPILQKFTFQYESKLKMNVEVGAKIAKEAIDKKKHNVIIFSHGLSNHLHGASVLCKELASQGYIVFSLQHYEPILLDYEVKNQIPSNPLAERAIQLEERYKHLETRREQVLYLIKFIKNEQKMKEIFGQELGIGKICLIGHSLGGASSLLTCLKNDVVDGVIDLDGANHIIGPELLQKTTNTPILMINTGQFAEATKEVVGINDVNKNFLNAQQNKANKLSLKITNSGHLNQVDSGFILAGLMETVKMIHNKEEIGEIWALNQKLIDLFLSNIVFTNGDKIKGVVEPFMEFAQQMGFEDQIVKEFV